MDKNMSFTISLITSDIYETNVFVQAFNEDLTLTFRFSNDTTRPSCLCSRIVTYYNNSDDAPDLFSDGESMRTAIHDAISNLWTSCATQLFIKLPDVIVQIDEINGHLVSSVSHESRYQAYLQSLRPTLVSHVSNTSPTYVPWSDLRFTYTLAGRSSSKLVSLHGQQYVYKGMTFLSFLELGNDFENNVTAFYHEMDVVSTLPKHPSILGNPEFLVIATTLQFSDPIRVCGSLYPYLKGDLQERIDEVGNTHRIPLRMKAKWASQVTSAVRAAHKANQYHMDIKPSNILLDHNDNALLTDWEQFGASRFFIAPEADGSWDLSETNNGVLRYTRYEGPERKNSAAWPFWNCFRLWQNEFPGALEAAEIYALGRTLWVLLEQVSSDEFVDGRDIVWTERADDVPETWKDLVACCCDSDPLKRMTLVEIQTFWDRVLEEEQ